MITAGEQIGILILAYMGLVAILVHLIRKAIKFIKEYIKDIMNR